MDSQHITAIILNKKMLAQLSLSCYIKARKYVLLLTQSMPGKIVGAGWPAIATSVELDI